MIKLDMSAKDLPEWLGEVRAQLRKLTNHPEFKGLDFHIRFFSRAEADREEFWDEHLRHMGGGDYPWPGPEKYRAMTATNVDFAYVLVDESETPESILWLILHEWTHFAISSHSLLRYYFNVSAHYAGFRAGDGTDTLPDSDHDVHPEEVFANEVATVMTKFITKKAYTRFDRPWWRARLRFSKENFLT